MFKMVTCYWCCLMSPQLSFSPATGARPVWPPWAHVVPLVWSDPAPGSLHLFLHHITSPSSGMEENQDSLIRGLYPVQHCCLLNMFRVIANLSESWDELTIKKQLLCCVTVEVDIQSQSNFTLASTYIHTKYKWVELENYRIGNDSIPLHNKNRHGGLEDYIFPHIFSNLCCSLYPST